jgi:outer membrane protein insertion porin family
MQIPMSIRRLAWLAFAIAIVCGWGTTASHAQTGGVIEQIVVEGNQRIEPETIAGYMTIKAGDEFDVRKIDESLKSLFDTGLFADVNIRREGNELVVRVVENPIINRIAFEGNRAIDSEDLEAEIQLRPRTVYTRTKVQNDVGRILELYRREGRFSASVEPKVIRQDENRVDLVFEIDEGEPTLIREINFIGNEEFSDSTLREIIVTKESAWYRFLSSDDTYDPDRLAFDRELLRRYYLSKGFADFRVVSVVADLTPDKRDFFITFTIEEGPRYEFGEIAVVSELRGVEPEDVDYLVDTEPGDWYNADAVEVVVDDITEELGTQGFAFVDVLPKAERDRENLLINVVYLIREGSRIYVERINVFGNVRTHDEVIRREFRIAEGDAFNVARVRRSETRIRALDYFEAVTITTEPGSEPDTLIINTEVVEKSTGDLTLGAGYSTFDSALFNASLRERNLLGLGQTLILSFALSGRRQDIDLSFTEPYFLDRDLEAGFDVFKRDLDLQDEASYNQESIGFVLRSTFPLTEHLDNSWFYTLNQVDITDVQENASAAIKDQEGSAITSAIGEQLDYDRLNDPLNPTDGYLLQQGTDFAGLGGDVHFLRNRVGATFYYPFDIDWTGSLKSEAGLINGLFGDDTRVNDRFYVGGASLRGFEPAGIGPRDLRSGDALGGNVFWTASAELTLPIGLPRELGVLGRVFTDWGTTYDCDCSGAFIVDDPAIRGSVGVGISYQSPLGPLRVDISQAVVKEDYDKTEIFRFSFGTSF